jgi:MoaA/NifB/PqqE/SkfB family radical SAM enzyme
MSGNGDPLASSILRPLIHRFAPTKGQQIKLFTNGLLIRQQIADSSIRDHISEYLISIDAGSKDVYEKVRLGGKWEQLLDNFDYLKELVQINKSTVALTFVVQRDNYLDMQNFCRVCIDYNFAGSITKLEDWGTWGNYAEHDVIGNTTHNEHVAAIDNLTNTYNEFKDRISFGAALVQLIHS